MFSSFKSLASTVSGRWVAMAVAGFGALQFGQALAETGQPAPWQLNFQEAVTPTMRSTAQLHDLLLVVIFAIVIFVLVLLVYVIWRFRASRNPVPSKTTHHTVLEVIWTTVPIIILVVIAVPSLRLIYFQDRVPQAEMTIKAIGHQWYWSYEYPDHGNFAFDAYMVPDAELAPGQPRLLATDNHVVVPVDTTVRVLVTAADVLHAWAVPAFGVKKDGIPGRINETWFKVEREGIYYGQCSELCGVNHAFMPIAVEVVSKEAFAAWVEKAKKEFAQAEAPAITLATNR